MFSPYGMVTRQVSTIDSTARSSEIAQAEYSDGTTFWIDIASPSSLSAGIVKAEMLNPATNAWVTAPQEICVIASGGGTPGVVNGNTASATAVAGGFVQNSTGITALTNTATIVIRVPNLGTRVRLAWSATSGTAAFTWAAIPKKSGSL